MNNKNHILRKVAHYRGYNVSFHCTIIFSMLAAV